MTHRQVRSKPANTTPLQWTVNIFSCASSSMVCSSRNVMLGETGRITSPDAGDRGRHGTVVSVVSSNLELYPPSPHRPRHGHSGNRRCIHRATARHSALLDRRRAPWPPGLCDIQPWPAIGLQRPTSCSRRRLPLIPPPEDALMQGECPRDKPRSCRRAHPPSPLSVQRACRCVPWVSAETPGALRNSRNCRCVILFSAGGFAGSPAMSEHVLAQFFFACVKHATLTVPTVQSVIPRISSH